MRFLDLQTPSLLERVTRHGPDLMVYAAVVAEAYEEAPKFEERAMPGYQALVQSNDVLMKRMKSDVDVKFTAGDPYKRHRDMVGDVVNNKNLTVYSGVDEPHPAFTGDENTILRAVHDYFAHAGPSRQYVAKGKVPERNDFTYRGELNAYLTHVRIAPREAIPILFTEAAAQISYYLITGGYAPQKAAILDGFDYVHLGKFTDGNRKARFDSLMHEFEDTQAITINVAGGMTLTTENMNWKMLSRGARAKAKKGQERPGLTVRMSSVKETFDTKITDLHMDMIDSDIPAYAFKMGDDYIEVNFSSRNNPGPNDWTVAFSRNHEMKVTGEGNSFAIFGAVINVIQDFMKRREVDSLKFSAHKPSGSFGARDPGRSNLYARLVKRFASKHGFTYTQSDQPRETIFKLERSQAVAEDVDSDLEANRFIEDLIEQARRAFAAQVKQPTWNADAASVSFRNNPALRVRGAQLGWKAPFDRIQLIIGYDPVNNGWYRPSNASGSPMLLISGLTEMDFAEGWDWYSEALIALNQQSNIKTLFHELVHAYQDLVQELPRGGVKHPDVHGSAAYYNSPKEFDARFRVIIRDYEKAIRLVRSGAARETILSSFDIDPDFRKQLAKLQDQGQWEPSGGYLWTRALPENKKKMIRRLYQIHQALFSEKNTATTEADEGEPMDDREKEHAATLAATGYWGNAGAGCLIMAQDTGRILIPLRSQWVQEPGTWGTWGGAIDGDEDPKTACMREVHEEAGYAGKVIDMIHLFRFQDAEFRYDTFLAVVPTEFEPELNWETERAEWVENGQWPSPLHFGLEQVLKDKGVQNKLGSATS